MAKKQNFALIVAALASASVVSAQTPSYRGALVISRVSLLPALPALPSRGPNAGFWFCSELTTSHMYSLRKQRQVPDIPEWVGAASLFPFTYYYNYLPLWQTWLARVPGRWAAFTYLPNNPHSARDSFLRA
jgi:hypothetical protein